MRPLQLTPRLLTAASFIKPGDRVLDIGSDHARLPVYLAERGLCAAVTAADRAAGPLERARRTVRAHGVEDRVRIVLCDGGEGLAPADYDVAVIAGMGGDTILSILEKSPWLLQKRLILQPQTRVSTFAALLEAFGCAITDQTAVFEGRRKYIIFVREGRP